MKIKIIFGIILIVSFFAVIIEIINPHSFLETGGAFLRTISIFVGAFIWYIYSVRSNRPLAIAGAFIFSSVAIFYLLYGVSSFCQNKYYNETVSLDIETKIRMETSYSCPQIVKNSLFGK
jgi:hypothetical protein